MRLLNPLSALLSSLSSRAPNKYSPLPQSQGDGIPLRALALREAAPWRPGDGDASRYNVAIGRCRVSASRRTVCLGLLILVGVLLPAGVWWYMRHLVWSGVGRWYWNYWVSFHPAIAYLVPKGDWGPIENPPIFVPEIYDAPHMSGWRLPALSPPIYSPAALANASIWSQPLGDLAADDTVLASRHRHLISPALVKLHIFSYPQPKGRVKRDLIRRLSPRLNVPPEYRHLVEMRFVMGYVLGEGGEPDEEIEQAVREEQEQYGDLLRLEGLKNGENLREGKVLRWMEKVGKGKDGGREGWWMFKVDDDTSLNLGNFLNVLLTHNAHEAWYVGTSLNRWPAYNWHFTGMVVGYSMPVVKSLAEGIGRMSSERVEASWDDDVLMGELMATLPSIPSCRPHNPSIPVPGFCDPHAPPPWGYIPPPPNPHPRTQLHYHDLTIHAGDKWLSWIVGDVGRHSFKEPYWYEVEWNERIRGRMWEVPGWMKGLDERFGYSDSKWAM